MKELLDDAYAKKYAVAAYTNGWNILRNLEAAKITFTGN
jgi:hypothetical protein